MKKNVLLIFIFIIIFFIFVNNVTFAVNELVQLKETEQPSMMEANIVTGIIAVVEITVAVLVSKRKNGNTLRLIIFGILLALTVIGRWALGIIAGAQINEYNENANSTRTRTMYI